MSPCSVSTQPTGRRRCCCSCESRTAVQVWRSVSSHVPVVFSALPGSLLVRAHLIHSGGTAGGEYTNSVESVQKRVTFVWLIASSQQTAVLSLVAWRSSTAVAGARYAILRSLISSVVKRSSSRASTRVLLMWRAASLATSRASRSRHWCALPADVQATSAV